MSLKVKVEPEYGFGWSDGHSTIETPSEFMCRLKCSDKKAFGTIISEKSQWFGKDVEVSPRHYPWDGQVNIYIRDADGSAEISGYAKIDKSSVTL
ncbi:hypothetical protein SAMN02745824_2376 [Parasphingorhabdus marina DSM 22363]|uniref:Uncharacterized protein n=1 Tax=Parasphingorhabdus marina DSM 22363 TaxID=1123272 RepID=A0A1N6FFS7_9SPHN|nr:hypothetical protein [Parasphingorhabdus marina]SIN94122.1 hypothetical protein SAMN02745824_2376 [Parasphingorhabdus marina DSM 22363]